MNDYKEQFIAAILRWNILQFGQFKLKSGRTSPYFFNSGLFNSGERLRLLGKAYAKCIVDSNMELDVVYGPAYKGIPLVCGLATYYKYDLPFAFNRKETKDHGEGGNIIGSSLEGNILIVDDVITSGISIDESYKIIVEAGATPCGVIIALDRQEKGLNGISAKTEVENKYGIPVISVINLDDIIQYMTDYNKLDITTMTIIKEYREQYGV